ncbi:DUF6069 family protein [uncultured Amnibacterium sp.]|uniref:DUF6069 family protein n=1 Tax=uncultured Amnibacterium sp. TaxID=1631851 RepID=UPI0035CB98F7
MTASAVTTTTTRTRTGTTAAASRIALAAVVAAVLTSVVNAAIALIAVALGATATPPLTPAIDIAFSVVTSVAGAIGWTIVNRRAADPRRVLKVLAPALLVVSFIPDIALGAATAAATGIAPILALALMHVTTMAIALTVYARLLPLKASPVA